MHRADVQFAWSGDVAIAYEVVGDGPIDLVYLPPFLSNLDWHWEFEPHARFLERLASFTRLIVIDRRGWGCSDRVTPGSFPPLEVAADDIITVLDAVGSSRSAVFAGAEGAWAAMIAAATHPDRFSALVLYQAEATSLYTEETPWNYTDEQVREAAEYWHDGGTRTFWEGWIRECAPSLSGDADAIDWFTKLARGTIGLVGLRQNSLDTCRPMSTRSSPPSGCRPVLFKPENETTPPEAGPYPLRRSRVPDSSRPPARTTSRGPMSPEALLGEVEEFLTGVRHVPESDRVLATVLFTDIVDSTEKAAEIGDGSGRNCSPIITTDQGGSSPVIAAARSAPPGTAFSRHSTAPPVPYVALGRSRHRSMGWGSRSEQGCTRARWSWGDEVQGLAVHIGARVAALAGPSQVLVSSTVKDLVAGSGLVFEDAGEHELKGLPDHWHLYRVVGA